MRGIWKKWVSVILVFTLIITGMQMTVYGENPETIIGFGHMLSVDDFNNAYVGPQQQRTPVENCASYQNASIEIHDLMLRGNAVTFRAIIGIGEQSIEQFFTGTLFNGGKQQKNIESYVATFESEDTDPLQVVLFNIINDGSVDDLMVHDELAGHPHLKLYFKDQDGNLLMFEMETPDSLRSVRTSSAREVSNDDLTWFWYYAEYTTEVIENDNSDNAVVPTGLGTETLWGGPSFVHRTEMSTGTRIMRSMPCVYYSHSDVRKTTNGGNWYAKFEVAESYRDEYGNTYYHVNSYHYTALEFKFACGERTLIDYLHPRGRLHKISGAVVSGTANLAGSIWSLTKVGAAVSIATAVANLAAEMTSVKNTVSIGSNYNFLDINSSDASNPEKRTVAASARLTKSIYLCDYTKQNGDYFQVDAHLVYDPQKSGSGTSYGAMEVNFVLADPFNLTETTYTTGSIPLTYYVYAN